MWNTNVLKPSITSVDVSGKTTAHAKIDQYVSKCAGFSEFSCEVGEMEPRWKDNKTNNGCILRTLTGVHYAGREYETCDRFLLSMCSRFGFGKSIFKLFSPSEVFERLQLTDPRFKIRVITENTKALSVVSPTKAYVDMDSAMRIISRYPHRIKDINYQGGILTSIHKMSESWDIAGDKFIQNFTLVTPVDGYGLPNIYLSLERVSTGAIIIAQSPSFRSEVQLGKGSDKPEIPLMRAIDTFNNEEGFQAIRQRLESARRSPASVNEVSRTYRALKKAINTTSKLWITTLENFGALTGDVSRKYGIATEESISTKRARLLPMDCTVADIINFLGDAATTPNVMVTPDAIYAYIGELLSNEYDLENYYTEAEELKDVDISRDLYASEDDAEALTAEDQGQTIVNKSGSYVTRAAWGTVKNGQS